MIVLADQKGNLIQANPAFREQFHYDPDALLGQSLTAVFTDTSATAFIDAIQTASDTQTTVQLEVVCIRQDNGMQFEAEMAITPLEYYGTQEPNFVCGIYDVSRHKQIEASLRGALEKEKHLNELKMRFSSMVSHEFRTPLTVILSSAGMLKTYSDKLSEEKKQEKLGNIESQVHRLVNLLDNILSLSRAENVQVRVTKKTVNLDEICREIVTEIQQITTVHKLELNISGDSRPIELDPDLMSDVLRNLLSNAVKYSPTGGTVELQCQYKESEVILKVMDEGLGIPQEDLNRLFDAFHRAKNVRDIAGTGLGLAIVKSAVEAHQGTVTVDSTVGVGTTFTLSIPALNNHRS